MWAAKYRKISTAALELNEKQKKKMQRTKQIAFEEKQWNEEGERKRRREEGKRKVDGEGEKGWESSRRKERGRKVRQVEKFKKSCTHFYTLRAEKC